MEISKDHQAAEREEPPHLGDICDQHQDRSRDRGAGAHPSCARSFRRAAAKKEVPTFAAFAEEFMASYVAANNKPSAQEAKRNILDNHLLPALGRLRLNHLTVQDFERLKARMLAKNLSRKRVNNVLNVLSKLLRYALELEIVGKIPIVKTLKVPPQKFDFFTDVELERLIDAAKVEPEWRTAIVLAADAGLRMGEILALEWGDIDLKAGLLTVMRSD